MSVDASAVDLDTIERAWNTFCEKEAVLNEVQEDVIDAVTDACREQINAGNYDAAAPLSRVFETFREAHLTDQSAFTTEVLESDDLIVDTLELGEETIAKAIFQQLIEHLVEDGHLLYVYNRQQVRSHVAEMTRYFALMRQRLTDETDYRFTPNLVKMVKMASSNREQPIMGRDREQARSFREPIRKINDTIGDNDVEPAWELKDTVGTAWRDLVNETMNTMSRFFDEGLPSEFDSLAAYQARAFRDLYLDAVTDQSEAETKANVVTASTGGGKTEAFLFPTLAYCLTATKAGISGNKAVLTYPRRDLCDNQFERVFSYVTELNRIEGQLNMSVDEAPLTISIQHGGREDVTLPCPHCNGQLEVVDDYSDPYFECIVDESHRIEYATVDRSESADLVITTQNSLHRRLMDKYGRDAFWENSYPAKFLVLDEVHIYTDQAGMNVANVVRRFKQAMRQQAHQQTPSLVASSATINNATEFTSRIFDTESATLFTPTAEEKDTLGREHFVFVKATDPRNIEVPIGDSVYKPREEWDDVSPTTATNLSCMIQVAFGFFHTMRKERAGDRPGLDTNKDRVLGFVDSIDSVSRLGGYVQEAEENGLFKYRFPDAILGERDNNPDCPRDLFRGATDDEYDEEAVCESQVPNPNLNRCSVYQDGECWWTMRDRELDLEDMTIAIHRSGNTQLAGSDQPVGDDWDQLITTSALEIGFDHASIIGTFQYRAPRNVPGFIQRKGRGGRDAEDEPITVVVLGSTPTDSYYFHHSDYLSDPSDKHLEIPLDEDNRFIRREHMTAGIIDYFNVSDGIDAERLFRGRGQPGPDVDYLQRSLSDHRIDLVDWLGNTFSVDESEATRPIEKLETYLEGLEKGVAPGHDDSEYWQFFSQMVRDRDEGAFEYIDDLIENLEDER
ncbi:DEAD/DEAH box helicase [Haloarcula marismortui]|uniref:DEAD/DEAH box helicase n=1 Tax=Haloarcula marismortui ATCC 33800 TaxID=662476 RepID=M0JQU2_9EURY|nr:DEAD/DEAH box helicase [Haloarcula sinaiiensis]EMA10000.1 putative helicase [Haloarcula sinaiiensis ATCC 33800]QUJ74973.1 DEAD/DEAH box helicase [Haloarcula sinaiiensis ATCC 33800]